MDRERATQTVERGSPIVFLLEMRRGVELVEVGVLVLPWRACRPTLAVFRMQWGELCEAGMSYAIQYARGGYPSTHNLSGDSTGRVHEILGKNDRGLPGGEAGHTLALARKRTGNSIDGEVKKTSSSPSMGLVVAFRPH